MSLNLEITTKPFDDSQNKNGTELLKSSASDLIARVIKDIRIIGLSPRIDDALEEIQQLNSAQKTFLLSKFGGSLRGIKNFSDATRISNALTA